MKLSEKRIRSFVIGIIVALVGYALCACDGGAAEDDGGVVSPNEPQALRCQVPSPTYDKTSMPSNGIAVLSVVVSNAGEARQLCEDWTLMTPAGVNAAGQPYPAACKLPGNPECSVTMTSSVCSNVADDFVDSAGGRHCFHLAQQLDGHGADECDFDTQSTSVRAGTTTCKLSRAGLMNPSKVDNRVIELCTTDGMFVGWQCPKDATD